MSVKIDLITQDHSTGQFVLILVEDGPWPEDASEMTKCLSRIQTRIYDAIDLVVDGHLATKYPESKGKDIRIQIDSPKGAPAQLVDLVSKLRKHILENGNDYGVAIKDSPFVERLYLTMGHERNPFN
jgi:hypothetical protein